MAATLKGAGFDTVRHERDLGELRRAIREFSDLVRDADIAVVNYAEHGIEVDGANYLAPADAKLLSDFDIEDETLSLDRVLKATDPARRLKLIILDACVVISCERNFVLSPSCICEKRLKPAPRNQVSSRDREPAAASRSAAPRRSGGARAKCFAFNGKTYCE